MVLLLKFITNPNKFNFVCMRCLSFTKMQKLETLAPRKADWDLKRDLARRCSKLERRTQKAIAELVRIFSFSIPPLHSISYISVLTLISILFFCTPLPGHHHLFIKGKEKYIISLNDFAILFLFTSTTLYLKDDQWWRWSQWIKIYGLYLDQHRLISSSQTSVFVDLAGNTVTLKNFVRK